MELKSWRFKLEGKEKAERFMQGDFSGETVCVPHTWNVSEAFAEYEGAAWYGTQLEVGEIKAVNLLRFGAVYHDAQVYVNGRLACRHDNSGYTPFETDITPLIHPGRNTVAVRCDNAYSEKALPSGKHYDWANDGGIIRPVEWLQKDARQIRSCAIDPVIKSYLPDGACRAEIRVRASLYGAREEGTKTLALYDTQGEEILTQAACFRNGAADIRVTLDCAQLWSPKKPYLYTLSLREGRAEDRFRFGVREIRVEGEKILFNGHQTKLVGIEWMPGSHPDYGMAEPPEVSFGFLQQLKDAGCNFTRFHWQQADFIYDWCDEHGLMVQEEIPYWGRPMNAGAQQLVVAKQQADEMVSAHRNHPSIVCWGVGNELNARSRKTVSYVKEAVKYFKQLDETRLVNYVSNTFGRRPKKLLGIKLPLIADATVYGDICMWNEYMGTWYGPCDYDQWMRYTCAQAKGKPFMVTEFGLCEPAFRGGDEKRIAIYKEKVALYRKYGLNGWIYFSLNDYRTHMGEDGKGRFRQRVHGSTDLYGAVKPSLAVIGQLNAEDLGEEAL